MMPYLPALKHNFEKEFKRDNTLIFNFRLVLSQYLAFLRQYGITDSSNMSIVSKLPSAQVFAAQ